MEKWKLKAKIVYAEEHIPFGADLYYFYQKHVRKSLELTNEKLFSNYKWKVFRNIKNIYEYGEKPIHDAVFFEFGAGWNLLTPIGVSLLAKHSWNPKDSRYIYVCVDLNEFMKPKEVYETIHCYEEALDRIDKLYKDSELPFSCATPKKNLPKKKIKEFLKESYSIDYRAPCDAGDTGLESESVDYIISNTTLQHIPSEDVKRILKECYRILKIGGVFSCNVSYMDHYSNFDREVSVYDFLQYSDFEWVKYNPPLHYQNRMRHSEYEKIFKDHGFAIIKEDPYQVTDDDINYLKNLKIDEKFRRFSYEELAIRESGFVLKKMSDDQR